MSQSSRLESDPLSDVLTVLGARSCGRTRLEAAGTWGLSFPPKERLKLVALVRGQCWLLLSGQPAQRMEQGDVFLMGSAGYVVASSPDVDPLDGAALYAQLGQDVVRLDGEETVLIGGSITFNSAQAGFLLDTLPRFLRIEGASPSAAAVTRTLALLEAEVGRGLLGGTLITTRLAEVLFVEAIRAYVAEQGQDCVGWLGALSDPLIGAALRLMHADVRNPWTVGSLAARVGMSRSGFSARFTHRVGRPPLDYLTHWRMMLAHNLLHEADADVASIAFEVGYSSPSAFSHAFKRTFGYSPRQSSSADV